MNQNYLPPTNKYEKTVVSTSGEVVDWLENKAAGASAEITVYLEGLSLLRQEALIAGETDVLRVVDLLAGAIARTTENRHDDAARSNGGVLPAGPDGVASRHEVSLQDIDTATGQFIPKNVDDNGPQEAFSVMQLHTGMLNIVDAQLRRGEQNDDSVS